MNIGDKVEIKEYNGNSWMWAKHRPQRLGRITNVDKHCYDVRTDDGKSIRDVREHFRTPDEQ